MINYSVIHYFENCLKGVGWGGGVGNPFADPKLVKTGPLSKVKATFIQWLISIHLPLFKTRIVWEYFPEEIEKVFFSSNKTDWAIFPL